MLEKVGRNSSNTTSAVALSSKRPTLTYTDALLETLVLISASTRLSLSVTDLMCTNLHRALGDLELAGLADLGAHQVGREPEFDSLGSLSF